MNPDKHSCPQLGIAADRVRAITHRDRSTSVSICVHPWLHSGSVVSLENRRAAVGLSVVEKVRA